MGAHVREIRVAQAGCVRSDARLAVQDSLAGRGRRGDIAPAQPRQGPQDGPLCHKWPLWFELEFTQSTGNWRV